MSNESVTSKKGILLPTHFFVSLLVAIGLHLVIPVWQIINWPYNMIGLLPLALGAWITIWADHIFKHRGTTVKPHLDPSELITTGPYHFSRHPMYVGMLLILIGVAAILGSITPLVTPVAFAVVLQVEFIPFEEEVMERLFDQQYRVYKQQVRQWL